MYEEVILPSLSPSRILSHIVNGHLDNFPDSKDYTYVILGKGGPTGKTWLWNGLRLHGFNAIELSECITVDLHTALMVQYIDDKNHFFIDKINKQAVIVLNRNIRG
jgi:hypothetical protein